MYFSTKRTGLEIVHGNSYLATRRVIIYDRVALICLCGGYSGSSQCFSQRAGRIWELCEVWLWFWRVKVLLAGFRTPWNWLSFLIRSLYACINRNSNSSIIVSQFAKCSDLKKNVCKIFSTWYHICICILELLTVITTCQSWNKILTFNTIKKFVTNFINKQNIELFCFFLWSKELNIFFGK